MSQEGAPKKPGKRKKARDIMVEFLLPTKDKGGEDLTEVTEKFLRKLYAAEFLWTFAGHTEGIWPVSKKVVEIDVCKRYFVITSEKRVSALETLIKAEFKAKTNQEKILVIRYKDLDINLL